MSAMLAKIGALLKEKHGVFDTPCYVYDIQAAAQNFRDLRAALGTSLILSVKANPNIDVQMHLLPVCSDGLELASLAELNVHAKTLGAPVFVNNPSMDRNLIRSGLGAKAHFVIDSVDQIRAIVGHAEHRPVMPLLLRLNTSVVRRFNPAATQLRGDHFGLDWDGVCEAIDVIRKCPEKLSLGGLHIFSGSYTFARVAFDLASAVPDIVAEVEARLREPLSMFNLGGGFSHDWREQGFDFAAYRARLAQLPSHLKLFHESGRGVLASCGAFLTRVVGTKKIDDVYYVVCDGGINQNFLLCQTENRLRKRRVPLLVRQHPVSSVVTGLVHFVGSSCSRDDVIGVSAQPIALPEVGDICVFDECGAYNATYTVSKFLGLKEPYAYVIP